MNRTRGAIKLAFLGVALAATWIAGCKADGSSAKGNAGGGGQREGEAGAASLPARVESPASGPHADVLYPIWLPVPDELGYPDHNKYGYIDAQGRVVAEPRFSNAFPFSEGRAKVGVIPVGGKMGDDVFGYIDTEGRVVIEPRYRLASDFHEGLAAVYVDGLWGYIDNQGVMIIPVRYDSAWDFSEGLAAVQEPRSQAGWGLWGYIDRSGKTVIAFRYKDAETFSEGLAAVKDDEGWAYIDPSGRVVLRSNSWTEAGAFSEGLAAVRIRGKMGYIDREGRQVIEPRFDEAEPFSQGRALVGDIGDSPYQGLVTDYWYIDGAGKRIIELTFTLSSTSFREGLAQGSLGPGGQETVYIDPDGKIVLRPPSGWVGDLFRGGLAQLGRKKPYDTGYGLLLKGYMDRQGRLVQVQWPLWQQLLVAEEAGGGQKRPGD